MLLFREGGYSNMTKAAKAFGKQLRHFWSRADTIAMLQDTSGSNSSDSNELKKQFTAVTVGRYHGGTWAHPELAVEFARWCNAVIKDIMTRAAEVTVVKPEQSEILKMPASLLEAGKLWLAQVFSTGKIPVLEIIPGNRYPLLSFGHLTQQRTACHCSRVDGAEAS